jgi:hypothetical protein
LPRFSPQEGFEYEIKHEKINTDGSVDINIQVQKDNEKESITQLVTISGINYHTIIDLFENDYTFDK